MASPQVENGYTKIANEIMDALARIRIPGEARQMLDVILRKTYGWNKKEDKISLSQLKELTGLNSVHLIRARKKLIEMNIIIVTQKGNGNALTYRLQKDCDKWKPLPKKVTLPKKVIGITQKGNKSSKTVTQKGTYKRKEYKDTITKERIALNDKNHSKPKALKIEFNFEERKWLNIEDKDLIFWKATYPACNIEAELNKMADWLLSNPDKRKTRYRRFISNWLSRAQDRGGTKITSTNDLDAWAEKQARKEKK